MNNTVELIGHYGSDEVHACSAWTSTSRDLTDAQKEIRDIATTMLDLVRNIEGNPFKYTIEAFGY